MKEENRTVWHWLSQYKSSELLPSKLKLQIQARLFLCKCLILIFILDKKSLLKMRIKSEISRQMTSYWNPPSVYPLGLRPNIDGSFSRQGTTNFSLKTLVDTTNQINFFK